jgi:ABC-type xylose transport system permease subunit
MNIKELKKNVRDYGMYIALFVIMLLFTIRNMSFPGFTPLKGHITDLKMN